FVRRLEENPVPAVVALLERAPKLGDAVLFNPPSTPVEVKTTFALLSEALVNPRLAKSADLSADEHAAIQEAVPWTRLLRPGAAVDPEGKQVPDLVERVIAEPSRFVLKRAWDYGGRAVFIGASAQEASFRERSRAVFGEVLDWRGLCQR